MDEEAITRYKNLAVEKGRSQQQDNEAFVPLPGNPVKACPRCRTLTLEGGHLSGTDVRHCFTCHGVFIGHPLPSIQDPLNPTPVLIGGTILEQHIWAFG